jgi:hypothetical protein
VTRGALMGALAVIVATGCGTTTVDESIAVPADRSAPATLPPIDPDESLVELVRGLADSMRHLDEEVIEGDDDDATLARIEEIWVVAKPLAREHSIDMEFGLEQSVDLARTSVTRRRPADASKGYKIVADLLDSLT